MVCFRTLTASLLVLIAAALAAPVHAEAVKFEAVVVQKEAIRLDFADASKHFLLMVRREGKSEGQGPLANTAVQEYGAHDVVPGVGGEPRGYLEFTTADGAKAYVKWIIQVSFVPGPNEKPRLLDDGVWQIVGATGKLEKLKGAGTLQLVPVGPTERRFILQGELVQ